jgi:catechol 2,3-dioxygenase-like lactoylglutathione lyase family enzyme
MTEGPAAATNILAFWHVGVSVADMETSLSFYRDGLGLEVVIDRVADDDYLREVNDVESTAIRIVYLSVPGSDFRVELLEHRGVRQSPIRGRPCDPGVSHMGFYVDDVDGLVATLAARGYKARSRRPVTIAAGPYRGGRSCIMVDPDGMLVELFQKPKAG